MKIKIMEYNILNGACTETQPYKLQKERLNKIIKIIKKESPDILVLCEAYFWQFSKQVNLLSFFDFSCKIPPWFLL